MKWWQCLGSVLLLACSSEELSSSVAPSPASISQVIVGTGERGVFRPAKSGDRLLLQRGCQGSQHIFTSLRVAGGATTELHIQVVVERVEDGVIVSSPLELLLPSEVDPEPGFVRITGLTPVIESPREIVGKEARVLVQVKDLLGQQSSGSLRGEVQWGLDSCGGHG